MNWNDEITKRIALRDRFKDRRKNGKLPDLSNDADFQKKEREELEKFGSASITEVKGERHCYSEGIRDFEEYESEEKRKIREYLLSLVIQNKLPWIYYDALAYEMHGSIFIDDHCTRGVLHPMTPIEVKKAMQIPDLNFKIFLIALLEGKIKLSGKKVKQSEENTCPKCGKFLASGATRTSIYYSCSSCEYSKKVEVYD